MNYPINAISCAACRTNQRTRHEALCLKKKHDRGREEQEGERDGKRGTGGVRWREAYSLKGRDTSTEERIHAIRGMGRRDQLRMVYTTQNVSNINSINMLPVARK